MVRLVVFLCWLRPRARGLLHRGVRKRGGCRSVAGRSYVLIGACPGDLHWRRAQQGVHTSPTEAILKCFSGPFCPRSHRCCASTLAIRNARQPSSAFSCALGGWWLGRCGVAGAPVAHLQGGQGPNVGRRAVYTGIFVGTLATYAPIPAVFFFFLAPFDVRPGPGYALAQARLMGSHPHQGPAIAGHTRHETRAISKTKLAEIRKAMSVGLAVIAAGGNARRFFS